MSEGFDLAPEQRERFAKQLFAGQKIAAIKELRELSGLDLKDSKEVIDRLEVELRAAQPGQFTGKSGNSAGCIFFLILLVLGSAAVVWFLIQRFHK